ncbi:hypothetical protein D3C77_609340 [compost metagenome]
MRNEFAVIQPVNNDLVQTQIGYEGIFAILGRDCAVSMSRLLAILAEAAAYMLNSRRHLD